MPQFDVYANPVPAARRSYPFVINLQSDLLADGELAVVAPLAPRRLLPSAVGRLTPAVPVDDQEYLVLTNSLNSLPVRVLEKRIANLADHRQPLMAAVDLLFVGV
jgi:toxin CcdB